MFFHYTDISNAVNILTEGFLYSRQYVKDKGKLVVNGGSSAVLAGTDPEFKDCVRLYFRPKTPTQFHAEGIRSRSTLATSKFSDAHCPVPIFLLFDSAEILTRSDCRFSDEGLGSYGAEVFATAAELERLPWQSIYQPGYVDPSRANAEVIVSRNLDLKALRYIYCRSAAERETLLQLLPPDLRSRYQEKIVSSASSVLFFRRHTFIEKSRLSSDAAHFQFSPDTQSPGPFHLKVDLVTASRSLAMTVEDLRLGPSYKKTVRIPTSNYTIQLIIDGHLAYFGKHEDIKIPF